jgi:hypothetical protein
MVGGTMCLGGLVDIKNGLCKIWGYIIYKTVGLQGGGGGKVGGGRQ